MDADRPFLGYLASKVGQEFMTRFYESPVCVISTYRMLPQVAQKCFLHLLYSPNSDWKTWAKRQHSVVVYRALQLLIQLDIVHGDPEAKMEINEDFRMHFSASLLISAGALSGLRTAADGADGKARRRRPDERDMMRDCSERWECILRYLALPSTADSAEREVPTLTRELFQYIGFTKQGVGESEISSSGFQFLLLNKIEQMWTYLMHCFHYLEQHTDVFPLIEFFLRLFLSANACDDVEQRYPPLLYEEEWPEDVKTFYKHLRELGLVLMKKRKDGSRLKTISSFFFVTPLMRALALSDGCTMAAAVSTAPSTSVAVPSAALSMTQGFLIVETNFRIYAYTDSPLQLAILSTFVELTYRFENVVVGVLTRDSVRRALQAGITGKQMIQYLRANAHPQTHKGNTIPLTVSDQICLWEQERKRLSCTESTLYSAFDSEADFVALRDFAQQNGVLAWHCTVQRLAVVSGEAGHELVREWWRTHCQGATG